MKKTLSILAAIFGIAILAQIAGVSFAAPFPTGVGGLGTSITPASGTIPIGNGVGSYTPAFLTPGANIQITNASGSVTIAVTGSTSSGTVYLLNGGHGISLSPSTITASGTISVVTSTIIADVTASGQFLSSSTTYVASVNGQSGVVALGIPATTTINGAQATVFKLIGDGTTVTSTANGTTTTFSIINTGNWGGTWQGVNSSTFYKASNPSGYISGNQTITLSGAVTGSGATSIATTYTTSTLYGLFSATTPIVFNSSTGVFSWTNSPGYITNVSINGQSGTSFNIAAGAGVTSTVSGATTTVTLNLGSGCSGGNFVQTISATGTITCATPSGGASSTNVYGISPIVVSQSGVNATTSCPTCLTTSTFNSTGTAWYITGWNASGNALLATTSIYLNSGNGYIGIGSSSNITAPLTLFTTSTTGNVPVIDMYNYAGNLASEFMLSPQTTTSSLTYINFPSTSTSNGSWLAYRFGGSNNKWFFGDDGSNAYFQTNHAMYFSAGVNQQTITSTPELELNTNGNITASGNFNASGTITQAGIPVCTTVTCLTSTGIKTSTSTYLAVYTSSGTIAGFTSLTYVSSTNSLTLPATFAFKDSSNSTWLSGDGSNIYLPQLSDGLLKLSGASAFTTAVDGTDFWSPTSLTNNGQLANVAEYVGGAGAGAVNGDCAEWSNSGANISDTGSPCGSGGGGSNNATGTIDEGAIFNATNTLASVSVLYVPSNFATAGCAGSSTATTFQGCVNALFQSQVGIASGTTVWVTNSVAASKWTATLNLNINGLVSSLNCSAGVALQYGGTGTALDFNNGNPTGHLASDDSGCLYMGHTTLLAAGATNTATTTGILFGGNQGAVGINFHGNSINGFGTDLTIASNSYMDNIYANSISGGNGGQAGETGSDIQVNTASNSGEGINIFLNHIVDPGNSSATNCVVFQHGSISNAVLSGNQIDDCEVYNSYSNGSLTIDDGNHFEDSDFSQYMPYIYVYGTSSQASYMNLSGNLFEVDDTNSGTIPPELIKHGQQVYASGNVIQNYGGQTIPLFIQHNLNNGTEVETVCGTGFFNGTLTNLMDNLTWSQSGNGQGCWSDQDNSYPTGISINSGNTASIYNGGIAVATYGSTGAWTIGSGANNSTVTLDNNLSVVDQGTFGTNVFINGTLNVTSTATFHATSTFTGNVSTTIASANCLGTNASGIIGVGTCTGGSGTLASTTNWVSGNIAVVSSSNFLASFPASSTATFYVDGNRTDSYTPNGSFLFPFKTLSAAIASSTGFSGYVYNLSPDTYVDGSADTFPSQPFLINGNESTLVEPSGVTMPGSFDIYDLTIVGNVTESDNNLQTIHQFNNGVIVGNVTLAGNATMSGMSMPATTSTLTTLPGSLVNVEGSAIYANVVGDGIQTNINDDYLGASSSQPAFNSTSGIALFNGATVINNGTGGAINLNNGATSTPNVLTNVSVVENSSTAGSSINCHTSACALGNIISLTNFSGAFIAPSGTVFSAAYDETRAILNAFSVGTSTTTSGDTILNDSVFLPLLTSQNCLGTNSSGQVQAGTCSGGSGGLASSTPFVSGGIAYDNGGSISASSSAVITSSGAVSSTEIITSNVSSTGNLTTAGTSNFMENSARTADILVGSTGWVVLQPGNSSGTHIYDASSTNVASLDTSLLTGNQNYQFPNSSGILCTTATCSGGGGSGNVAMSASNAVAGDVPYIFANGSSTISATSSLYIQSSTGNVGVNDTTPSSLFSVGAGSPLTIDSSGNITTTGHVSLANQALVAYPYEFAVNLGTGSFGGNASPISLGDTNGADTDTGPYQINFVNDALAYAPSNNASTTVIGLYVDNLFSPNGANLLTNGRWIGEAVDPIFGNGTAVYDGAGTSLDALDVEPIVNVATSSTSPFVDLHLNPNESSTPSGTNYLILGQVNSSTKFSVTDKGNVGIGTSTPSDDLVIATPSSTAAINCFKMKDEATANTYDWVYVSSTAMVVTATRPSFCEQ